MFLSADKRKISYKSKNGNLITLELKNSKAEESLQKVANMGISQADKQPECQGLWAGIFDTLSFYVAEGIEIAAFGMYDEPVTK